MNTPAVNDWTCHPAGDRTLVFEFGQVIDSAIVDQVVALDWKIRAAVDSGRLTGVRETIPTFRSLAVIYDPLQVTPDALVSQVRSLDTETAATETILARQWLIPVHYGGSHGPDLHSVAKLTGLDEQEVVQYHLRNPFKVYMLGFLPGFAFLGDTPAALHLPRRAEPRVRVPAGSVAIAMQLTGIYPWDSPGGWHILGNSPVPLFDGKTDPPALFKAGDTIRFRAIDEQEFDSIKASVASGHFTRESLYPVPGGTDDGEGSC